MTLPKRYDDERCSLARALEVVGERWTLLIVRDAFYGVRRFNDFAEHLNIPRAVLADRLKSLVAHGVLAKDDAAEYALTATGRELWPMVYGLLCWGDAHYAGGRGGPARVFEHAADGGRLGPDSTCTTCGARVDPQDVEVALVGRGSRSAAGRQDPISVALRSRHRLLEPLQPA